MVFPVNMLRIRNNATIKPIHIADDRLQYLRDVLKSAHLMEKRGDIEEDNGEVLFMW